MCDECGFIFNETFDATNSAYSGDYEETQAFSPLFRDFISDLARRWVHRYNLVGKSVVELGCGKGEFLVEMIRAGARSGVGIDPGVHPERIPDDVAERLDWVPGLFPDAFSQLDADAVICRHTLEHIAPVAEWMAAVRSAIGDRHDMPVLFELPDVRRVLEEGAFWDVYYEHCSYFSAGSLARLFRRTGFQVLDLWSAYDGQYLIIEAIPLDSSAADAPHVADDDRRRLGAAAALFANSQAELVDHWRSQLRRISDLGRRSVVWGSGSKAVAFLAALETDSALVEAAVDINPNKHDKYLAGSGHRIISPKQLVDTKPDLVIAMNPAYIEEIRADLDSLGIETRLDAV